MKKRAAGLAAALVLLAALVMAVAWRSGDRARDTEEPSALDGSGVAASGDLDARAARDPHGDASVSGAATARAPGAPAAEPGGSAGDRSAGHSPSTRTSSATSPGTPASSAAAATARPSRLPDGGALPVGSLDPGQIRDVVRNAIPELRFCFEWQLSRHPDLAGRVTLEFRIAEDGTVEEPGIAEDELGDETVLRCFRGVTGRMRFPPPEGGSVTVRYPITLASGDEPPTPPTEAPAE